MRKICPTLRHPAPTPFFLPPLLAAQTGTIRGFVYDEGSGEPVIFTNVYLEGTTLGSATDVNGYYSITKIQPGTYTLMVTALGFDTLSKQVSVGKDQIVTENLFVRQGAIQM